MLVPGVDKLSLFFPLFFSEYIIGCPLSTIVVVEKNTVERYFRCLAELFAVIGVGPSYLPELLTKH